MKLIDTKRMTTTLSTLAAAGLFASSATTADAATTILVNQVRGSLNVQGAYGTGTGEQLAPVAFTGSTWNNVTTSGTNLLNSDGVATTVGYAISGQQSTNGNGGVAFGATYEPYLHALWNYAFSSFTTTTPWTLTLTGLTVGQAYDMHAMVASVGSGQGSIFTMTSGATVPPGIAIATATTTGANSTSFVFGDNYTTVSWVADSTTAVFSIAELDVDPEANEFAVLNGIQLVAIPEPSTALLGGLGMLALLRRRRS